MTIRLYAISTVRATAFTKPSYGKGDFVQVEKKEEDIHYNAEREDGRVKILTRLRMAKGVENWG